MSAQDFHGGKRRLEQTWRWFGPDDPVPLAHVRMAGATGVVSALHAIPNGEVWPLEQIEQHKRRIEEAGLTWSVVESVPVHEDIKRRTGRYEQYIDNYRATLRHLGQAGIRTVCYNFMPVLDWTRTELDHPMHDGSTALRYDRAAFVAFDVLLLQRPGAEADYTPDELLRAERWLRAASPDEKTKLQQTVIAGLPGAEESYSMASFLQVLQGYAGFRPEDLRDNLTYFLSGIVETAEEAGVRLTLHPDDPPFPLLGLPRVAKDSDDLRHLFSQVPSAANGLCFCTGSFGVSPGNDLPAMVREFADRIGFVHLRSTRRTEEGDFFEADHLDGDVDMYAVVRELLLEQQRRDRPIPFRPDHGHKMLDDLGRPSNPGYSAIGRLRGLAELRGLELGILRSLPESPL